MSTIVDPDPPTVADTFDIQGHWVIVYSSEFYVEPVPGPAGSFGQPYKVRFETVGSGDYGGVKFKGPILDPPDQPGTYYGETLYNGRGTHLVQMVMRADDRRYFQTHSGAHWPQEEVGDEAVHVRGGWVDVGHQLTPTASRRDPYKGLFRMTKL